MSRSVLLVFLVLVLIVTSQIDWNQPLVNDSVDTIPTLREKQLQDSIREEAVKEKIILSQERNIQKLVELVDNLREQLHQCRNNNKTANVNSL